MNGNIKFSKLHYSKDHNVRGRAMRGLAVEHSQIHGMKNNNKF